jgi:hypothetical protein
MVDARNCEHCGTAFSPRREHARFCSVRCRVAWNRANSTDPASAISALEWSVIAMRDVIQRLTRARARDRPRAFALVGEAVWWVTIVDATLVRHHLDVYDRVLAASAPTERRLIDGTLAGLRFVRNQMGDDIDHVNFICPATALPGDNRIAAWRWRSLPEPVLDSLADRGKEWEMTRYRAYQDHLAEHAIGEVFGRAAAFLNLTVTQATSDAA